MTVPILGMMVISIGCTGGTAPEIVGVYRDVSESDSETVLRLNADGSAVIQHMGARVGEPDVAERTGIAAVWSKVGTGVAVRYRTRVDTLEYSDSWSTAEFGVEGEGPGLKPMTPSEASAFVGRLVLWRAEFLEAVNARLP